MKYVIFCICSMAIISCKSQMPVNHELKEKLDEILFKDQILREYTDNETTAERKNEIEKITKLDENYLQQNAWNLIRSADSANIITIENIIAKYGYPGKSLVGEPTNTAAFYVIQHSDKIEKYYPIIEKAGKRGELPFKYAAMMLDRKLTGELKPQVYGTQLAFRRITNPKTGTPENFMYVLPIEDAKNVNKRRKKAGFDTTVEENAKRFGIEYKEYTYEELNDIK